MPKLRLPLEFSTVDAGAFDVHIAFSREKSHFIDFLKVGCFPKECPLLIHAVSLKTCKQKGSNDSIYKDINTYILALTTCAAVNLHKLINNMQHNFRRYMIAFILLTVI